jgi:hypothetical protein
MVSVRVKAMTVVAGQEMNQYDGAVQGFAEGLKWQGP